MAGIAKKIADRFKPGIFDRLKQSKESKTQAKERRLHVVPPPKPERKKKEKKVTVDIETTSPGTLISATVTAELDGRVRRQEVWRSWNAYPTAITTCAHTDTVWNIWHGGTGSSLTCNGGLGDAQTIWQGWTGNTVTMRTSIITSSIGETWEHWQTQEQPRRNQRPVETPQQRIVREQQEEQYRAQRAAENARWEEERRAAENRRKEADDRAMVLLVSMLNEEQKADLKRYNHFFVEAPSGRLYRIDYGMHGNVKVVDRVTRKIIERLCIQPNGVPAADANLMQKLLIETAEDTFRAHANITLEDGRLIRGRSELLDNTKLAPVIPIFGKEQLKKSFEPVAIIERSTA